VATYDSDQNPHCGEVGCSMPSSCSTYPSCAPPPASVARTTRPVNSPMQMSQLSEDGDGTHQIARSAGGLTGHTVDGSPAGSRFRGARRCPRHTRRVCRPRNVSRGRRPAFPCPHTRRWRPPGACAYRLWPRGAPGGRPTGAWNHANRAFRKRRGNGRDAVPQPYRAGIASPTPGPAERCLVMPVLLAAARTRSVELPFSHGQASREPQTF
jgi:hypothetical protein